jgi:uncharacterized protein (TIGR03437 family)
MATLSAQYGTLATTGNGVDLYFSTTLPLKGSGLPEHGRIYKVGSVPLAAVVAVARNGPADPCGSLLCISNAYDLAGPEVSRDGAVFAYVGRKYCTGHCTSVGDLHVTTVRVGAGQREHIFGGQGRLSGSGQYFVGYSHSDYTSSDSLYRTDLRAGGTSILRVSREARVALGSNGRTVADNGDFIAYLDGWMHIFRNGEWVRLPLSDRQAPNLLNGAIDAHGSVLVYQACCTPSSSLLSYLRVYHPATGEDAVLVRGNGDASLPVVSADGRRVAFRSSIKFGSEATPGPPQVFLVNPDGSGVRAVTNDDNGIKQFTLSDDGQTLWYLTGIGALYQLNIETGDAEQRIPPTCKASLYDQVSPGSAASIAGGCLGREYEATFDGIPGFFISQTAGAIWVQAPWTLPTGRSVTVSLDAGSPFETLNTTLNSSARVPRVVRGPIHQDWTGYVHQANPARRNEVVHFYATGLGPVQPAVSTGAPGPAAPPSWVVAPFECNVPVHFAGLAPGLVGFYQISLRMPASGGGSLKVSCTGVLEANVALEP